MPTWLTALLVPLFFIGFAILWSFMLMMIASMGWRKFASRQATDVQIPVGSERISFGSLSIGDSLFGTANYGGCMNFYIDRSGLFLRPSFMFRIFHPALHFRWNDIRSITERKIFLSRHSKLDFGSDLPPILIGDGFILKAGSRIEQAWRRYSSHATQHPISNASPD